VLRRSLGLGVAVLVPGLACSGNDDAQVFGQGDTPSTASTSNAVPPASTVVEESTTTTAVAAAGLPRGAELVVSFTYQQAAGGRNEPPYVAVWVENDAGELLQTISLWYRGDSRGTRWLPDLKRWFAVDDERIDAGGANTIDVVSSATRLPGSYSVVWDGLVEGEPARAGDHHLCIESVRERGPYSLIREPVTFDGDVFSLDLPSDNELVEARAEIVV
jgi:hypothetical protein